MLVLCYVMPLMIAPQVTALAWLQLFGASPFLAAGLAPPLGTQSAYHRRHNLLLGVQYAAGLPLVRAGLRKPRELVEAARAGGAGWFTVLRTVVLLPMTPYNGGSSTGLRVLRGFCIPLPRHSR